MTTKHELLSLLDQLNMLKTLTQTYQQIAATHIRCTRTSVVRNRDFITELLLLFQDVKTAYRDELITLMKQKKIKNLNKLTLIKRNGKTAVVFIAANTGFYGNIVNKTSALIIDYLKKNEADVIVIGKVGESLFKYYFPEKKYKFFEFPDSSIDTKRLSEITTCLLEYEKIMIFYAQFQSIITQNPTITLLDSSIAFEENKEVGVKKYLFEPSLEKIVIFFETEIFGLFFEQTMRESQLAKQASRMYSLDQAIQNINKSLQKTKLQKNVFYHRTMNTKQINSLVSMRLWKI